MWLVSCRRQGTLTEGPAPDPKCKLNTSSFLTLPHLSDYLISTRNSMSVVLLLQMMGRWVRRLIYNRVWEGGQGSGYYVVGSVFVLFFSLALLSFVLSSPLSLFYVTRA